VIGEVILKRIFRVVAPMNKSYILKTSEFMTEQAIGDVMRNAQVWSNTGKNYASIVGNEFAD